MNLDAERERLREEVNQISPICRNAGLTRSANLIDSMLALINAQASALAEMQRRLDACFEDAEIALASKEAETIGRAVAAIGPTRCLMSPKPCGDCRQCDNARQVMAIRALGKTT